MRVLVYPRDLELGGSSINAVDFAVAMRQRGHDVALLARPGPLENRIRRLALPLTLVDHPASPRPSPAVMREVSAAVRRLRVDLVHTFEFWPCVEAFFAASVRHRVPVLGTIMTMGLAPYLPASVPLTVGYGDLLDEARATRRAPAYLLEPPVDTEADTEADRAGVDPTPFRTQWRLDTDTQTIVMVSRAATAMKQEGIERAMDAVSDLATRRAARLVMVGGGSAFDALWERAERINQRHRRAVVVLTGPLADPRPAYAAADLVVGMGSSVLRGMAFGKAALVIGEQGFSLPVTPTTLSIFDRTGFYGVGSGRRDPLDDPLSEQLASLLSDDPGRARLGEFGRDLVRRRFDVDVLAEQLETAYAETLARGVGHGRGLVDAVGTAVRIVVHKIDGRRQSEPQQMVRRRAAEGGGHG